MSNIAIEKSPESPIKQPIFNCIPPFQSQRNGWGLLEHINYIFNPDGTVNYKEMLVSHSEFLAVNKKNFEKRGQKIPENIKEVEDKDLLILLNGFKHILSIRGYISVEQYIFSSSSEFVSGKCRINFLGNYETANQPIIFEDTADATINNTSGFGKIFLTTICANRAFVRCVRNALKIPILGSDEVAGDNASAETNGNGVTNPDQNQVISPIEILRKLMIEDKIDFEKIKLQMLKKQKDNPEELSKIQTYKSIDDLPKNTIFDIIGKIKLLRDKKSGNYNPVPE